MAPRSPRVLITRSPRQSSELADRLRALGADLILIPAIEFAEPTSFAALDAALTHLDRFHWLLFTSANAVDAFHRRLHSSPNSVILSEARSEDRAESKDPPHSQNRARLSILPAAESIPRIAAIGPSTARALQAIGLTPDLIPPQAVAESLTEALLAHARQPDDRGPQGAFPAPWGGASPTRFLLIRAESVGDTPPREYLPETLRAAGAEVTIAPAYRTVIPAASIPAIRALFQSSGSPKPRVPHLRGGLIAAKVGVDAITFTSSSTARNLLALCEAAGVTLPAGALRISIGPITSQTLRDAGYPPHAEAAEATVPALAEAVLKALKQHPAA
ncbi:MAG TPA: uroporphyrinogen-III synthase [Acidobacteriaceae bacterium]|jgi:uroporphyrinogen-III synthase|nr:uroporphyrinogen-III synthase [Acidobacteriaceae bacterium]